MANAFIEQAKRVYDDQQRELTEIRRKRKELNGRVAELDAQEIDVLLSIRQLKELLRDKFGEDID